MGNPLLILGAGGQVGQALLASAQDEGFVPLGFSSADVDITSPQALAELAAAHPDAPVINAAAYTAVDKAETEAEAAYAVNAVAPSYLAAIFGLDRPLIHFSTDYVFAGEGERPFTTEDATAPLGVYGMSKRMGEAAVLRATYGTVIRTAWVYGATGNNFLKTMIRVGRDRGALKVVDDQIGTPTHAEDIAAGALALLKAQMTGDDTAAPGLYHLTAKGSTSWHGFAAEIFAALKDQTGTEIGLDAIPSTEYPTPAKRPAYSVLDCSKIDKIPGVDRPDWQARVASTVAAILTNEKAMS